MMKERIGIVCLSQQGCIRNMSSKHLYVLTALFIAVSVGNPSVLPASENGSVYWIGINELRGLLQNRSLLIVDLRTPREFRQGSIPGSVNVPIEDLSLLRSLLDEYKNRDILLYCRTVNKTSRAIWILRQRGFRSLYALRGGYESYRLFSHDTDDEALPAKEAGEHPVQRRITP
ncbi:MAG: rhodanese-like domain-containing protein [Syntrophales bacterium]